MPTNLLVTGSRGAPHVTSAQAAKFHAGIVGDGQYVMAGMTATMTSSNTCHIDPGVACMNGRDVEVPAGGVDVTVDNGTQAQNRNDLVCLRYTAAGLYTSEAVELVCIKGTATSSAAKDPSYNDGSVLDGDSPVDMPLWRIPITGVSVGTPVQLFETIPSILALRDSVSKIYNLTPNCTYWKAFGTVFLSWQGVTGLRQGWNTIGTLPAGFRPTSGYADPEGTRVSGLIKMLGNSGSDSTGTIDVYSSGLARVWFPRSTSELEPSSGQVFFRAD